MNSRLLTLMSRRPAGGLTYTVLAGSTANGVAWPWLSLSPPIARPQIVTVERSFLPFLHLPGLVGVDGGVLFLLGLTPSAVDIYLLIILGWYPPTCPVYLGGR